MKWSYQIKSNFCFCLQEEHDGLTKGRDRVCRNNSGHLISSYINVDKEPVFYKSSKMTWVANELMLENKFHFFLECMRIPPDWHLWVYFLGKYIPFVLSILYIHCLAKTWIYLSPYSIGTSYLPRFSKRAVKNLKNYLTKNDEKLRKPEEGQ